MNRKTAENITAALILAILAACSSGTPQSVPAEEYKQAIPAADTVAATANEAADNEVAANEQTIVQLQESILMKSGKVRASKYIDLYFNTQGHIAQIYTRNGERIEKGDKLAELEMFTISTNLRQAEIDIRQASLELQDIIIGQGYNPENQDAVPAEIMRLARVKSGYETALLKKETIEHEMAAATLTAPFNGIIANLTAKPNQLVSSSEPFCRIIQEKDMEIVFHVLESELHLVTKGQKVVIEPMASSIPSVNGEITEINPIVDDKGLIQIKALVKGNAGLMEGMNATVYIHHKIK